MRSVSSLKSLVMAIIGALVIVPALYATPPEATLDKQEGKKQDQFQNELDRGSEQGQLSRMNRMKWWIFEMEEEPDLPPPDEDPDLPPPDEDPYLPPPGPLYPPPLI